MTAQPLLLGIDLGTSALKCGLFDLAGHCLAAARVSYPTRDCPGGAEQDANDWWEALVRGVGTVMADVDGRWVAAIGVGGHAPSPVLVDDQLRPIAPVLPWFDARWQAQRERLLAALGRQPSDGAERLVAQLPARALWLRGEAPGEFAKAACILHSGDYLVARLTRQNVTTSPVAVDILAAAGLSRDLFPTRECRAGEVVGPLAADAVSELGLAGAIPVVAGGLDSFLASVGSGMSRPGDACLNTGSSAVVAVMAPDGKPGRFEWADCQIHSRPLGIGGRMLERNMRSCPNGSLDELLGEAARLPPPLALHQQTAGLFDNLSQRVGDDAFEIIRRRTDRCSPAEIMRLLVDRIFLRQRSVLEKLERETESARRVRAVGGLAARPDVVQLQADILGRAVETPRVTDSGALGAAMVAAAGLGFYLPAEAAPAMVTIARCAAPRLAVTSAYEDLWSARV